AKSDSNIYVTFAKVSGAYKYNLYRSVDGGEFTQIAVITGRYTDKNTIPGKTYTYKLASVRGNIITDCSPAASAVCYIAAPNIYSASSTGYNSVTVKWNRVTNATEYKIYRSTEENDGYTCIGTVNSRTYKFTAGGLDTGTTYYFRVAAGKASGGDTGCSDMGCVKSAVPSLNSATKIWGSPVGKSAIFVEWSNVAGADGYELYAARSGQSMTLLEDCDKYYYSHKNLTTGDKYSYRVRAYRLVNGSKVYSGYSKTIAATVPKTLSNSTYSWSYANKVVNNQTPDNLIKAQEKAGNIQTLFVGDTTRKVIYLTMDCGNPSPNSDKNLNTLKEKNVKATFFVALPYAKGSHAQIQRMINEGHIVGNHTKSHIRLNKASSSVIQTQVKTLENYIYDNFNYRTKYFRYPYGSFSQASQNELIQMGYTSAGWSFAYNDYSSRQPSPSYALNLITKNIHPGAIFLLHMDSDTNTAILGDFIDKAREMGYEFETLDDIEI
ncbi:MAG: polysaccharide deacetylase family protein, partial [Firmicutes bacterium]|nr:polysaccharide deacetylase family protein [Bacillota bacterium]